MRQIVVDTNTLQSDSLLRFLANPSNRAVFTYPVWVEVLQKNPIKSVPKALSILSTRRRQIDVLKPPDVMMKLSPRSSGLRRRMLEKRGREKFVEYLNLAQGCKKGDQFAISTLREWGRQADLEMAAYVEQAEALLSTYRDVAMELDAIERSEIKARLRYSPETQKKILDLVSEAWRPIVDQIGIPKRSLPKNWVELIDAFSFRYAFLTTLVFKDWIAKGENIKLKPDKLKNSLFDAHIMACGTYFDGVLTADAEALALYNEGNFVLKGLRDAALNQPRSN